MPILQLLFLECIIVLMPVHTLLAGDTNSFEKRIKSWKESVVNLYAEKRLRISSRVDIKTPEFYEIVAIGIPCLKQLESVHTMASIIMANRINPENMTSNLS